MRLANRCSALLAGLLIAAAGCARNPATGSNQLMLVSESQEIEMGRAADKDVIASIGLYPDSNWQRYIQAFGARLAANSERPNLPWTFRVVDDAAVNAFALPGGFIYVTRGILANLNNEAELAGVVGHEIGHVTARHTAHEMSRQQLAQLGLVVGAVASPTVAQYAGLASQAMSLVFLKFSRDDESQADHLGLRYMGKTGFDEREMPQVFVMLGQVSAAEGGSHLPQWLETHPDPENRRQAMEQEIAQLPAGQAGGTVNAAEFVRRVDGLVYGADPRDGFFRGNQFIHPGMRFRMDFPQGWKTANTAQAVQGVSSGQDAAIQLTLAQERSADAAARAFAAQQGLQAGSAQRTTVSGLTGVVVPFAATTDNGALRGNALFVEYNGTVFNLIGYAPEARWAANEGAVDGALKTFGPLTDPTALAVQPQRLDVFTAPSRTTIAELVRSHPSPLQPDMLALINQVQPDSPIEAGHLVKWVTGPSLEQANRTP